MLGRVLVATLSLVTPAMTAAYDDRPINEDEYFGARMQGHQQGAGLYQEPQGGGRLTVILAAIAGASIEWFWTARRTKQGNAKLLEEKSQEFVAQWQRDRELLMTRRTNPIKALAMEVEEADMQLEQLIAAAEDAGVDHLYFGDGAAPGNVARANTRQPYARSTQQDNLEYEEFRQPDVNGDNVISKIEFNQYIRKYLALYPDTAPQDIPMFEEFDLNKDGMVTFDEWQMYLDKHRQTDDYADSELMRGMYDTSANSNGFNSMDRNMQRQQGRRY